MRRNLCALVAVAFLLTLAVPRSVLGLTDEEVVKAIDKAKENLIGRQGADGKWPETTPYAATAPYGNTEMALFTLLYTGEHTNREHISKGLDAVMNRNLDYTYAVAMRAMAYAYAWRDLSGAKKDQVHNALKADTLWLCTAQLPGGGWDYKMPQGQRFDFSNTQMAILALREAALAGIEIPDAVWQRTQRLYTEKKQADGSWNYGDPGNAHIGGTVPGYGSMTAAGLASIFITGDNLDLNSGCPCRGTVSNKTRGGDVDRLEELALAWLSKNFKPDGNPKAPDGDGWNRNYWLYGVERVGIAAGYKYFGDHNWYKEGAEWLLKNQAPDGSWGDIPETCFSLLFLYKGRAPVLFNKLEFKGEWNNHRRDIAHLTAYIEKNKEQMFHWQITNLKFPVEELHDAPVLYITAETPPTFTDDEKKKLRAFTDTGGTILFEASCGNPAVRKWFADFVKEMWPEWPLKPLSAEHGSFNDPNPLKQRPEIFGIDDGVRTFLFYANDDISCAWQTRAVAGKDYVFKWGLNLFTYATDKSPLRSKLASREALKTDRYDGPVKAGEKTTLRLARLKYEGTGWRTGRNYQEFEGLASYLQQKAGVTLKPEENGVAAADLGDRDVVYLVCTGALPVATATAGLKEYLGKGGFLWIDAAGGAAIAEPAVQKLAADMGWQLKPLAKDHAILAGAFKKAVGYNLSQNVLFSRTIRISRAGRPFADLIGIYQDGKLVGVYSPLDVMFSTTGYQAYGVKGYQREDALAVATNIMLYLTDRTAAE